MKRLVVKRSMAFVGGGRRLLEWGLPGFGPRGLGPRGLGLVAAGAAALLPSVAPASDSPVEVGVGLALQSGIAWSDSPSPSTFALPRSGDTATQESLSGFALSGGLLAEARFLTLVGLQVGAFYARDRLGGNLRRSGQTIPIDMGQDALHVPILLKGIWPRGFVSPFAVAGAEYVLPTLPSAESEPRGAQPAAATANPYWNLVFGAGAELRTPIEGWDLRVPLGVRFAVQPGLGGALEDRVRVLPSDALIYTSTPRYDLQLTAGALLFF